MPTETEIEAFRDGLVVWANKNGNLRSFPWRETTSPYQVLIAEILLGATLAQKAEPIFEAFIARYPNPESLAEANGDALAELLEPLGLHNRRSKALIKIGDELAGQGVPQNEDKLMALPYVGPYATNATLCFAFNDARPIVDSNVVRVYERAFGLELDQEQNEAWDLAARILPETDVQKFNLALLDFAATICKSGTPRCEQCFFSTYCNYYNEPGNDENSK